MENSYKALPVGTILKGGEYTILDKIGEDDFSITYAAQQNSLNRKVCIKEYFLDGCCFRSEGSLRVECKPIFIEQFEKYRKEFVREAEMVATINHLNVVDVIAIFSENNTDYMVMQFIESQTLSPGATQQTSQTQQAPLTSQAQSVKRDVVQKRRKNKTWLWIFLAILACLIIVAVVTSVHNSGSAANKDTEEQKLGKEAKQTITVNGVSFDMVYVEGGTFTMGCTSEQGSDCDCWEKPYHQVTLSNYYIGETEVTQALWKAVMGSEPTYMDGWTSEFGYGDNYPAYRVSWDDVQIFIRELNRITGRTFRLPTEAEWEYAARGGSKSRGYKYSGSESIDSVAWYRDNSGNKTHPVKTKRPNELGLYDMSGNVSEWCSDWFGSYIILSQTNPEGSSSGSYRVNRGGSWGMHAWRCRVSDRNHFNASLHNFILGFRLVLVQ